LKKEDLKSSGENLRLSKHLDDLKVNSSNIERNLRNQCAEATERAEKAEQEVMNLKSQKENFASKNEEILRLFEQLDDLKLKSDNVAKELREKLIQTSKPVENGDQGVKILISKEDFRSLQTAIFNNDHDTCRKIFTKAQMENPFSLFLKTFLNWDTLNDRTEITRIVLDVAEAEKSNSNSGETFLHVAARTGQTEIVKKILSIVEDKNPKDNGGNTPLHSAAEMGQTEIFKQILAVVEDKNPKEDLGWTPLHLAAAFGYIKIVEKILSVVEDKNPADIFGRTPICLAEENNQQNIAQMILEALGTSTSPQTANLNDEQTELGARSRKITKCQKIMRMKRGGRTTGWTKLSRAPIYHS